MSNLLIQLHPDAEDDIEALALSENEDEQLAASQILALLELIQVLPNIRDRMLVHHETIYSRKPDGGMLEVDIKLIKQLKDIAEDSKYHADAVRRIRNIQEHPASNYRVFFAPRQQRGGMFKYEVLGVFKRDIAYSQETLDELKKRYES